MVLGSKPILYASLNAVLPKTTTYQNTHTLIHTHTHIYIHTHIHAQLLCVYDIMRFFPFYRSTVTIVREEVKRPEV